MSKPTAEAEQSVMFFFSTMYQLRVRFLCKQPRQLWQVVLAHVLLFPRSHERTGCLMDHEDDDALFV